MKANTLNHLPLQRLALSVFAAISLDTSAQTVTFEGLFSDPLGTDYAFNAAWADYDADGFVDVCTVNNERITLYRNNGNSTFTRITTGNPLVEAIAPFCNGVLWGDYDNDGLPDIFVFSPTPSSSRNYLFHNEGNGTFSEILDGHIVSPVPAGVLASSAVWGDFDKDGWLDLFVGNWIGNGQTPNYLYRNEGGAGFSLIADDLLSQAYSNPDSSLGSVAGDFDNDGLLDILNLAVDPTPSRIYRNLGAFHFEVSNPFTDVIDGVDRTSAAAVADYDNDGDLDILTGAMANYAPDPQQLNGLSVLWQNDGDGTFTRSQEWDLMAADVIGTVGMAWGDYDNDGWLDVVLSRGAESNVKNGDPFDFLFRNNGDGTFSRVTEGEIVTDTGASMNSTWADINNDGFLDLLICNYTYQDHASPNLLMLNKGNSNRWLKLALRGTDSNADAIGAKIRMKATIQGRELWQLREIGTSQGNFTSQSDMRPHFGLGDATVVEVVRIEWPSGLVQELANVNTDQILKVTEPSRLSIRPAGTTAILSWSARAEGHVLHQAASPNGPWQPVDAPVVIAGHLATVEVSGGDSVRLYRLQMP